MLHCVGTFSSSQHVSMSARWCAGALARWCFGVLTRCCDTSACWRVVLAHVDMWHIGALGVHLYGSISGQKGLEQKKIWLDG
jgi:hypothetical protein